MNRRTSPILALRRSRGVGIVMAIFLLIAFSLLGIAMVNMSTSQAISSQLDVQGARAYQAARAGAEWGIFRRLRDGMACNTGAGTASTFALPADASLAGFTVTVVCIRTAGPLNGAGVALDRYRIVSTACNRPGAAGCPNPTASSEYIQRIVEVQL